MAEFRPKKDHEMRTAFVIAIPRPDAGETWDAWITEHDARVRAEAWAHAVAIADALPHVGACRVPDEPCSCRAAEFRSALRAE